jgi:hypothetical protein
VVLIAVPVPAGVAVLLTGGFGLGLSTATLGLYLGLLRRTAPRLGLLAAVFNALAAALLVAMILVQLAIGELPAARSDAPALAAVHLGLDVAWDLYIGAGTLAAALALRKQPGFGVVWGLVGIALALALLTLNALTFPTPPGESGLVDVGPLVGLWYTAVLVRLGWLVRASRSGPPTASA